MQEWLSISWGSRVIYLPLSSFSLHHVLNCSFLQEVCNPFPLMLTTSAFFPQWDPVLGKLVEREKFFLFVCSLILFWLYMSKADDLKNLSKGPYLAKKPKACCSWRQRWGFQILNDGIRWLYAACPVGFCRPPSSHNASYSRVAEVPPLPTASASKWNLYPRGQCILISQLYIMSTDAVEPGRSDDFKRGVACKVWG